MNNSENEETGVNDVAPMKPSSPPTNTLIYQQLSLTSMDVQYPHTHATIRVRITVQLDV